jgi:EmrB/QacA subfamily drug resistance transporter
MASPNGHKTGGAVIAEGGKPAEEPLSREVYLVAGVVIIGVIMSVLDTTIVNVALETLSQELHSPLSTIQWVSTGYLLSLAMVIPLTGWMSEKYGAKQVWMSSVALFGIGSALCGLAWNAESLIFFRVLQGFGGGMIMPVGMAVLAQVAGPHRVGRVMSVVGVPMLLGPILGPVLGGLIVDNTSWRWIFYVNIPIVVMALVLAWRVLDAKEGRADAGRLDWTGFLLLSPALGGIVFGLSESETHGGFADPLAWVPIVTGAILIVLFVRHAWRAPRPLIDLHLLKNPGFSAAAASTTLLGGALFGAMLVLPLYYQVDRGETALTAGLLMAPQGLGAAMVMPFAGRWTDRIGGGRVALVGVLLMTAATIPYAFVSSSTPYWLLGGLLVFRGIGLGSCMMPSMAAAYSLLERPQIPRATSLLNVTRQVGGSIGTALLAVTLQREIKDALGGGGGGGSVQRLPEHLRLQAAGPLGDAFAHTFGWALAMSTLAIIPVTVLALTTGKGGPPAAPATEQARDEEAVAAPA